MSKDAQHDKPSNVEQAGETSAIQVLLRLPDVRKLQFSNSEPPMSVGPRNAEDSGSSKSGPGTPQVMGPLLDSLRRRWSTWKNAAMFAQVGVSSRFLVVGGLVIGMVLAAYLLIDRQDGGQAKEIEHNNTAQEPVPSIHTHVAAPHTESAGPHVPPVEAMPAPMSTPAHGEQTPVASAPRARLELEATEVGPTPTQPAINVIETPQQSAAVYSADAHNHERARTSAEYQGNQFQRPAVRGGEHAKFERHSESRDQGYRGENSRANSSDQFQRDFYAPADRQSFRGESRFAPRVDNTRPEGAGFRGTIEPAPYRNR